MTTAVIIPSSVVIPDGSGSSAILPENAYDAGFDDQFADISGYTGVVFVFGPIGAEVVPDGMAISRADIVFRAALASPGSYQVELVDNSNPPYNSQDYAGDSGPFTEQTQTGHVVHAGVTYGGTLPVEVARAGLGAAFRLLTAHVLVDFVRLDIDFDVPVPPPPDETPADSHGHSASQAARQEPTLDTFAEPGSQRRRQDGSIGPIDDAALVFAQSPAEVEAQE
jgi:hypothetical protein